ncbi:MAG: hypothetical protein JJE03_06060 [Peptostreptococcaceae bacterium]|nr:hypothetical protein [Peptostreptococcaceae bacterium]
MKSIIDIDEIKSTILNQARDTISKEMFDIECPHCNRAVSVPAGKSNCPFCNEEIDLTLDFEF